MTKPGIKKNPDGTFTVVGAQERVLTQQQADYEELLKSAELLPGESGFRARELIRTKPTMSGGLLSSLVENGAVPNNKLVSTLVEIDQMTQAERAKNQFLETQRIANERFNNSIKGQLWSGVKGLVRGAITLLDVPFELVGAGIRSTKQDIDAALRGDINFLTRQPTDPTKTREDLGLSSGVQDVLEQSKLYQAIKQWRKEGRIDAGAGFTVDESSGIGFAARNAQMQVAKVRVKLDDGRFYDRPYSLFDPIVEFIPGIQPDTGTGSVVSAIGDVFAMLKLDPGLAYSRIKQTRDALAQAQRTASGMKSATIARDLALKDIELTELAKQTEESIQAFKTATGVEKLEAEKEVQAALARQLQLADDMDKMTWNPDAVAAFLSGKESSAAIDALANMDNWEDVYAIGKKAGKRGGFTVEQSKVIAAAKTREEVLAGLAPYIADGKVVANVLETGTKVGNALRNIADSSIVAGKTTKITNSITGLAARGAAKLPYIDKVAKTVGAVANGATKLKTNLSRSYNTVVPGGTMIHSSDKDALVDAIYGFGRATNVPEDVISQLVTQVAYSDNASEIAYTATGRLFNEILKANLDKAKIDAGALEKSTRVFQNGNAKMGSYWAERHAAGAKLDYVISGDKTVTISGPHLDSEYLNSVVYLPPAKEILNIISFVNRRGGNTLQATKEALDVATNTLWKRMVLIRPAYIIRNIAEMQIRVMGTGHVSFFNNPVVALGMWLGRSESASAWRRVLDKLDPYRNTLMGTNFKLGSAKDEFEAEVLAHDAADSYITSQAIRGISSADRDTNIAVKLSGFNTIEFGHESGRWWEGLASEIRILSNSIGGRVAARTAVGKEQAGVDFVLRGAGKDEWDQFTKLQKPEIRDWLRTDEGAMSYLFTGKNGKGQLTSVRARVDEAAGKNGEASQAIKNLIAFGKIDVDGLSIAVPKGNAGAANSIKNATSIDKTGKKLKDANQEFGDILRKNFDGKGDWDGLSMNVPVVKFGRNYDKEQMSRAAGISDAFFDIAVRFEKTTTMGPEWRQKYWDAIHDIAGALDAEAATKLAGVAQDSLSPLKSWKGEPIGSQHKVWNAFKLAKGDGNVTLQQAHEYASTVASRHVRDLFYDASRKRLLFHQLRLIAPFGQAWEDTIKAWGNIALNNPMQVYKVQKVLNWLTNPESSALYQLTDAKDYYDPNQGFLYTDPLDGQRKFFLPFVSTGLNFLSNLALKKSATSGPFAVSSTPQSLNFAFASGSIMPGVGPGISFGLATLDSYGPNPLKLLPVGLREQAYKIIYPFGEPNLKQGFLESFMPGNWRRILAPVMPDESYAASFAPTMNYLASGGNYNLDDRNDQERLVTDTSTFAKWFTIMRGFFGAVSPFQLQFSGLTTLEDGNTLLTTSLYNDFKQLEVAAGGDKNKAYNDFFNTYSPNLVFAIISSSAGGPTNLFTYEAIKDDPSLVTDYGDVYGYAYPGGGYSAEMYRQQQRMGNKVKFTPRELVERATLIRYYAAKDTLLARATGEGWDSETFNEANESLRESFAGLGLTFKYDTYKDVRIADQLNRMAVDPRFEDSDAVRGLRDYLYLRQKALDDSGRKTLENKASLPEREWLAEQAKEIIRRNPEFQNMFYAFFKKELEG